MTTDEEQRQRIVYLIRHGEKNPSTVIVDPNQLTESGRRGALAYGARLQTAPSLDVYCSTDAKGKPVDRSHDTGWYIHAGYAGLEYDAANELFRSDSDERRKFVPGLEARLEQQVPDRVRDAYKAGTLTRAQAMEQCYKMVLGQAGSFEEQEQMIQAALKYQDAVLSYLQLLSDSSSNRSIVLVGHDPNIGCLQQLLVSPVVVHELKPLEGPKYEKMLDGRIIYRSGHLGNGVFVEGEINCGIRS